MFNFHVFTCSRCTGSIMWHPYVLSCDSHVICINVCLNLQTLAWETRSAQVPVSPAPPVPRWSHRRRLTPTARSTEERRAPATSKPTASLVLRKVTPSPLPSPHTFPTWVRQLNPSPQKEVWQAQVTFKISSNTPDILSIILVYFYIEVDWKSLRTSTFNKSLPLKFFMMLQLQNLFKCNIY